MPKMMVKVDGKFYDVGGLSSSQLKTVLDAANEYADELKRGMELEIAELTEAVKITDEYIDGAFLDGIITELEAKTIKTYLNTLSSKKAEMDREYLDIFGNVYANDESKAILTSAKQNYDEKYESLINEIQTAISDGEGTAGEAVLIDQGFLAYNQAISLLVSALNSAIDQISNAKDLESYGNMQDEVAGIISPISTKVLLMESEISQSAEQILLRVTKSELQTELGTVRTDAVTEANDYADGLKAIIDSSMSVLESHIDDTDTYIDNAFKDQIITSLEASGIEKYLNQLNIAKESFDTTHTEFLLNTYLKSSPRSNLVLAKTNLDTAYSALISSIQTAITDSTATPAEAADVDAKFLTYSENVSVYNLRVNQATDSIAKEKALEAQTNAGQYTDGQLVPIRATLVETESTITQLSDEIGLRVTRDEYEVGLESANTYSDNLKTAIDGDIETLTQSVNDTNIYIDGTFKDGIIYDAELKKIQGYLLLLAESKNTMDSRYTGIYSNTSLVGTPKSNLATAKTNYDTKYNSLVSTINNAVADQLVDSTESSGVNTAFTNYNNSIALLGSSLEAAVDAITGAKSTKALADAKVYTDGIKVQIDGVINTLDADIKATDTYIEGAFKDGIVSAEEAKRITGYINIINESKGAYDQRYTELYGNASLGSTFKSELQLAKTSYDNSYNTLISSINTAIADGVSTNAEALDVDTKFKQYNLASKTFTASIEKALDNITKNKADQALSDAVEIITPIDNRLKTAEGSLVVMDEAIQAKVSQTDFDIVAGKVTNNEASLTIMSGEISSKVTSTQVQAEIDKIQVGGTNMFAYTSGITSFLSYNTKPVVTGQDFTTQIVKTATSTNFTIGNNNVTSSQTPNQKYALSGYMLLNGNPIPSNFFTNFNTHPSMIQKSLEINPTTGYFKILYETGASPYSFIFHTIVQAALNDVVTFKDVKLEKGNQVTDWSPAPEDIDSAISGLSTDIGEIETALTALDTEIKGTFKDGLITEAENLSIKKYINTITVEKSDIDSRYNTIYAEVSLTGTPKTDLASKKTAYNTAHTNLINSINTAIADGKTTTVESADVDSKFALYKTALSNLSVSFEVAISAIAQAKVNKLQTDVVTPLTTRVSTAESKITAEAITSTVTSSATYTNALAGKATPADISTAVGQIDIGGKNITKKSINFQPGFTYTSYSTGISNLRAEGGFLKGTATTTSGRLLVTDSLSYNKGASITVSVILKTDSVNQTSMVVGGKFFSKANLGEVGTLSSITGMVYPYMDGFVKLVVTAVMPTDRDAINEVVRIYIHPKASIDTLDVNFEIKSIKAEYGNKATDWSPAPEDIDNAISGLDTRINTVSTSLGTLDTEIKGTFKDGLITEAESLSIKKYINTVTSEKSDLDSRYNTIYADVGLTGTPKTDLASKKTAYNTAHTNLMNSINAAIADSKTTTTESADVDAKFALYRTALANLSISFEVAIGTIAQAKVNKLQTDVIVPLTTRVSTAESKITAEAITNTVTASTKYTNDLEGKATPADISTAVGNIVIGGKNLMLLTSETKRTVAVGQFGYQGARLLLADLGLKHGDDVTYGVYVSDLPASQGVKLRLDFYREDGTYLPYTSSENILTEGRYSFTYKIPADVTITKIAVRIYPTIYTANFNISLTAEKMEKGNKATDWTPAPRDVADNVQGLAEDIGDVSDALTLLDTTMKGSFKDGLITEAESLSIKKYINTVTSEKSDLDSRYNTIYADTSLTGTPKTDLATKKTAYNTAHTNLINSINTAVADGKTTTTESADVDSKFTLYRTALSNLSVSFEIAISAIAQAKVNKLQTDVITPLDTRVQTAESKITAEAITNTVTSSSKYVGDVNSTKIESSWIKDYPVNATTVALLVHPDGTALSDEYTYEFQGVTMNTGTVSTAIVIFKSKGAGAGWTLEVVKELGTGSNHPRFFLDANGKPSIGTSHASIYTVQVKGSRQRGRESTASSLTSQIKITADAIDSRVAKTDYNGNTIASLINQTATTIKLEAENIELNGITEVADTLYIGGHFNDSGVKSIEFRGDLGGAAIESLDTDQLRSFAVSTNAMLGNYKSILGGYYYGAGTLGRTQETEIHAINSIKLASGTDTVLVDGTKTVKLNGKPVFFSDTEIIAEGVWWMTGSHTIYPTKSLAQCPNGWILVWGRYTNGAAVSNDWNFSIVPKSYATMAGNTGMWCILGAASTADGTAPPVAYKYVFPRNTHLIGHSRNGQGTESGQVLRYILAF